VRRSKPGTWSVPANALQLLCTNVCLQ
jgi:hypothetical protein